MTINGGDKGSDFDFQIGTQFFDMDIEEGELRTFFSPEYEHHFDPILATRTDISGGPGQQNLLPQFPLWTWDRWDGGEGNSRFNPQTPFQYARGLCNPRVVGQLQGPPIRTDFQPAVAPAAIIGGYMTSGAGYLWLAGRQATYYSNDAASWTKANCVSFPGNEYVTAIASDGTNLFVALHDSALNNRDIHYMNTSTFTSTQFQVAEHGGNSVPYKGMAVIQSVATPYLFAWTGHKLWSLDLTAAPNVTNTDVFDTGLESFPSTYYADCVATDNSIVMFYGSDGQTTVYEYKAGVGTPLWNLPVGFTGRCLTHAQGVVFIAGTIAGVAAMYALNLFTQQRFFLDYIRQDFGVGSSIVDLTPVSLYPGNGAQILIGIKEGYVFIYDAEANAFSELGERASPGTADLSAVCNYVGARVANFNDTVAANFKTSAWAVDTDPTTVDGDCESGFFDFNLPEESKTLLGFHVLFKPLTGDQFITVYYSTDETPFVVAGTITTATDGNATGNVFLPVSDAGDTNGTISCQILRSRLVLGGGSVIYALTAKAYILRYTESWQINIRIRQNRLGNKRARFETAEELRDYLLHPTTGIVPTKQIVTFKDGNRYRFSGSDAYTTHTVMVEQAIDLIDKQGYAGAEGKMRLVLRSVL